MQNFDAIEQELNKMEMLQENSTEKLKMRLFIKM